MSEDSFATVAGDSSPFAQGIEGDRTNKKAEPGNCFSVEAFPDSARLDPCEGIIR
jgi:hypothetical protein